MTQGPADLPVDSNSSSTSGTADKDIGASRTVGANSKTACEELSSQHGAGDCEQISHSESGSCIFTSRSTCTTLLVISWVADAKELWTNPCDFCCAITGADTEGRTWATDRWPWRGLDCCGTQNHGQGRKCPSGRSG